MQSDSVPLSSNRLLSPTEILGAGGTFPLEDIHTSQWSGPIRSAIVIGTLPFAILAVSSGIRDNGFEPSVALVGDELLAVMAVFAFILMLVPYEQVHINILERRVRIDRGRYFFFRFNATGSFCGERTLEICRIVGFPLYFGAFPNLCVTSVAGVMLVGTRLSAKNETNVALPLPLPEYDAGEGDVFPFPVPLLLAPAVLLLIGALSVVGVSRIRRQ